MSRPEPDGSERHGEEAPGADRGPFARPEVPAPARYGRFVGLLALVILALITLNTILTKPIGHSGIAPGNHAPPFAVPLALGSLQGAANTATRAGEGAAHAACTVRGPQVLNVCELYERGPVVLALFVNAGGCEDVLGDMQRLAGTFPGVRFAGVAIRGDRASLRRMIGERHLTLPVGIDVEGALASRYALATCPQVSFIYPGGVVQSRALLKRPSAAELRTRVAALVAASRARGWHEPAR